MEKYRYEDYEKLYTHVMMESCDADNPNFAAQPRAMQALHVVLMFDMEIQNGGVAQFFWNQGSAYAALVPEMLRETGFEDIAALYEDFLVQNHIQMEEIDSYREQFPDMSGLYDFHPFDSFDKAYMKIWEETNFNDRILQYAARHPEIYGN